MPNTDKIGWDTNSATRPEMLAQLKDAIDKHLIEIYDKETVEELMSFVKVQHSGSIKAEAERGAHDDLVMPLAIVYKMYQAYPSRALSTIQMVNQPVFNNDRWRRRR
jgi:hypothetical protein